MPKVLSGIEVAEYMYSTCPDLKGKILAIITVGNDDSSSVYVRNKIKAAEKVGLKGKNYRFSYNKSTYKEISDLIKELNQDDDVVGIMIQRPYNKELEGIEEYISYKKDVDGLTKENMYNTLSFKTPTFYPATPQGIMILLNFYKISIASKHVVIINRSDIVGKPLAAMMSNKDAAVTICHSKTNKKTLRRLMHSADIIVSAIGKPKFWKAEDIGDNKPVLIDVGTNRDENGKLCGDFDIKSIGDKCCAYSPSPKGIGLVTVASLILNCCKSFIMLLKKWEK